MRDKLEYIINDLTESFDGKPWYGDSVMKKLRTVNWKSVNEKVYGNKTTAVLLQHIINWRIFVIKKLQGDEVYDIIIDELNDWTPRIINNEREWEQMLQEISNTQSKILEQLGSFDDDLLDKLVPGKKYTFGPILRSVSQHDIYHLGQIAMLNTNAKT
ncbi:DinB family protein [Maribacter sp. HTCC2170]|uniref:DinB family protein n=1 Tax=Maribacter sp. (strain HTCC2170 / KCCM 42371) TaxID=313603 RepID=UPI00006BD425|nr:DinB family protein [Maribacter sp. HTCC2170]EAR02325.1 hypothetical protein FB2170_03540 [Maribacter sp. HTCC2170]